MTSYDDILVKVTLETLDFDHTRWPVEVIYEYIFEAQKEYARLTGCLVANSIVVGNTDAVYSVPSDFIRPLSFRNISDEDIKQYSYVELDKLYGGNWLINQGQIASGICFDYGTEGTFYLIPVLPDGQLVGTLTYVREPKKGIIEISDTLAVLYYVLCRLYESEKEEAFIKKFLFYGKEFSKRIAFKTKLTGNRTYSKGSYF